MYDFIKDPTFYNLVRGPFVWIAFLIFIGGSIYQVRNLILLAKKEKVVYPYLSLKFTLRSIFHWLVPFASVNSRRHPVITIMTYILHIGIVFTPIFLLSHNILWRESWGITWWTIPEGLGDALTILVIVACIFFFLRRIFAPEVNFVTFSSDYLILAVTFLPFITGFLAYHQLFLSHKTMVILHIFFGEIMLVAVPFTRIIHMFYFFLTRAYMGSDQGFRHSQDW